MNFTQSLEDPRDTPVLDEEGVIFDTEQFNRRILDTVRVSEKKIEGITIDEQSRIAEFVTNERISDMIHNKKKGKNKT